MFLKSLGNLLNIKNSTNQFKNIRHQTIKLLNEQPYKFDMSYYFCQEEEKKKKKRKEFDMNHCICARRYN